MFSFGKKTKIAKLMTNYVSQRINQKKFFEQQLERLNDQLKKEKIDLQERDRLTFMLQKQFYERQEKQWKQIQEKYENPIN